jgi:phosphoglycolate phosphatase-like HAD superfamily hydrolase
VVVAVVVLSVRSFDALVAELESHVTVMVVNSKPVEYADPILEAVGLRAYVQAVFGPSLDALTERKATSLQRALSSAVSAITSTGRPR